LNESRPAFPSACSVRRRRTRGGKRRRILRQRKGKVENFSTLKEKNKKKGARQKINGKFFCFVRRQGGRRRWVGLPPVGRQSEVSARVFFEKSSDFIQ